MFPFSITISFKTELSEAEIVAAIKKSLGSPKRISRNKKGHYELEPKYFAISPNLIPGIQAHIKPGKLSLNFQNPWFIIPLMAIFGTGLFSLLKEPEKFEWAHLAWFGLALFFIPLLINGLSVLLSIWTILLIRKGIKANKH